MRFLTMRRPHNEQYRATITRSISMPNGEKTCECGPSKRIVNQSESILKIKWKRLISNGETCPRCGSTERELRKAVSTLKRPLAPLGIKVILEKEELSDTKFRKIPYNLTPFG
jgi:Domain of unknown function (DUF2703)